MRLRRRGPVPLTAPKLETQQARELMQSDPCAWCGGWHARACPKVRRLVQSASGTITEVEFWPHGQWPTAEVIWPEDVAAAESPDPGKEAQ